ncbi:hypothetical protein RUND412_004444 [Rhizina undulata]
MSESAPSLPASFPQTPATVRPRRPEQRPPSPRDHSPQRNEYPAVSTGAAPTFINPSRTKNPVSVVRTSDVPLDPVIPLDVVDAPTQRLYAVGIFILLQAYKFYDVARLYSADGDSISELWFCIKWLSLDGSFFWFLPLLKIPWLTFTPTFTLAAIGILSVTDIIFSLKYQIPITAVFVAIWKLFYDRELSISEKSVKWYDIVNNNSHIQGKYTVHILPEGAAKLNPKGECYCLGDHIPYVTIPIRINGTQPINIQLQRIDFNTAIAETIEIPQKEIKKLMKKAPREDDPDLHHLPYIVKQPGLYRLTKVKDVSMLDVRVYRSEALVVPCPKAVLKNSGSEKKDKCKGEMTNLALEVQGLAPLQVTYTRELKGRATVFTVQSIHPENYESPLLSGFNGDGTLAEQGDPGLAWMQPQTIAVPLNESLGSSGDWVYAIDKVGDACGNSVDYNALHEDDELMIPRGSSLTQKLVVHERPQVRFFGCDPQNPMDLPKGRSGALPLQLFSEQQDVPYDVRFTFTPDHKLLSASEHAPDAKIKDHRLKAHNDIVAIKEPGLYTIKSISSGFCAGDIMEPASCLVITPPEPSVTMEYDEILDKCTESSIGLTIDLTLVGTPPFDLSYRLIKDGGIPDIKTLRIERTRHQVRFTPEDAGHYAYEFFNLDDKNYRGIRLDPKLNRVEQTVKPLAGANFVDNAPHKKSCIEEPVEFRVKMQGTSPLTLHYDLIHNGKRKRITNSNITSPIHTIRTPPLLDGGEYSLALTTVEDQSGCKIYLEQEAKISVRWQRPKAQFAPLEGKMNVRALEGKAVKLPLRLAGESPWTVKVKNLDSSEPAREHVFTSSNSFLTVKDAGRYHLEEVRDNGCPGSVTESDSTFEVSWIERPKVRLSESSTIKKKDDIFVRQEVCEGDEDAVELAFTGSPPFTVDYERIYKPKNGQDSRRALEPSVHKLTAGLGVATVRLETSKAGLYQYKFARISDGLYDDPRESKLLNPLLLEQTVHPRPATSFANPTKVYKYCLDAGAGDDLIPIKLEGVPPFSLLLNIKHFSTGKSDVITVPNVDSTMYNFRIPPHALTLGNHAVSVLEVRDSRGCVRKTADGPNVMVAVADMPTISAADQRTDYCVGDRISFSLAGVPPFAVEYEWNGVLMKATNQPAQFVRVAEKPGNFTITGLQDSASDCQVNVNIPKVIHEVPSVKISEGTSVVKGIPEGDQAEILFSFYGTPPFTFTYTRSEIARKGAKPRILEMHSQTTDSYTYSMFASQEGTYEVISIEDKYCGYSAGKTTGSRKG